jgi:hypothetical protein
MVGRLDGPTPAIARRLVDDALEVERTGLRGVFYVDARGLTGKAESGNYVWFDRHLLHLSEVVKKNSDMKLVLDKNSAVFPPGSCLMRLFIAAGTPGQLCARLQMEQRQWVITASSNTTLTMGSNVWCKRLLEEGAHLGPWPNLPAFLLPDQFLPLLMTGNCLAGSLSPCSRCPDANHRHLSYRPSNNPAIQPQNQPGRGPREEVAMAENILPKHCSRRIIMKPAPVRILPDWEVRGDLPPKTDPGLF